MTKMVRINLNALWFLAMRPAETAGRDREAKLRDADKNISRPGKPRKSQRQESAPDHFISALVKLRPKLVAYAMHISRNAGDAEDLAQETIVKAMSNWRRFDDGSNLSAWAMTILRNTFLSNLRKLRREIVDTDLVTSDIGPVTYGNQEDRVRLRTVSSAFDQLAPAARRTLLLVGAYGLTYERAAEIEGCAIGTVKSRASRARLALAQLSGEAL